MQPFLLGMLGGAFGFIAIAIPFRQIAWHKLVRVAVVKVLGDMSKGFDWYMRATDDGFFVRDPDGNEHCIAQRGRR